MTVHLDKSIHIRAPPERVYRWLAPHRQPRWDPSLVRATPLHGRTFERVGRAFGHRFESHVEATTLEAARRFAWRQLEGDYAEHEGAYTLEPEVDGTRVHLVADVDYPYVMPEVITEAEIRRAVNAEADEALMRLKELVERARRAAR